MATDPDLSYAVVRRPTVGGHTEVSLVRLRASPHRRLHHAPPTEEGTLFSQRFPPRRLDQISTYEATLERVGAALQAARLGAWVKRSVLDNGDVELDLYRQRFDGTHLTTDLMRSERIAPDAVDAVAQAASVLAELRADAARIDDELEEHLASEMERERAGREREEELVRQGLELRSILDDVDR